MKQICLKCERNPAQGNLFCQEVYCPAEMSPYILDYGEYLGDIEIIKVVTILRSAVIYEARHQKKKVFLKVAHPNEANKARLKREAEVLKTVRGKAANNFLPELLPPYANTSLRQDVVGKSMLGEHLLYYYLFSHNEGKPLRDWLEKNPQPWINHIGWIMIGLTSAVSLLHNKGFYMFGLSPEGVLVDYDAHKKLAVDVPRVLLVDFGLAESSPQADLRSYSDFVLPAYTAPELLTQANGPSVGYSTDIYGLGLLMYELLIGQSAYTYKLQSDHEIHEIIQKQRMNRMNRYEDVQAIAKIAEKAVAEQPAQRYETAKAFAKALRREFNDIPPKPKSRIPNLNQILAATGGLLAVAFVMAMVFSFM